MTTSFKKKDIVSVVDEQDPWYGRTVVVTGMNLYGLAFCTYPTDRHDMIYTSMHPLTFEVVGRIFEDEQLGRVASATHRQEGGRA
jgi:Asp-tRNA(Asn)/Glu-tRNA(Gln) amidotransferase A subunit family amidase